MLVHISHLEKTLFGAPPKAFTEKPKNEGQVDLSDKQIKDELAARAAKRKADVGDTEIEIDKAWHGIHCLPSGSLAFCKLAAEREPAVIFAIS